MEVTSNRVKVADPVVSGVGGVLALVAKFTNWFSFFFFACLFVCLFVFFKARFTWRISARSTGLKLSPASQTDPLKIKLSITWRGIQPGAQLSPG